MNTEPVYVLDACALIAAFNGEDGAAVVQKMLTACAQSEITIYMSAIQVLEVYYDRIYTINKEFADEFLATLAKSGVIVVNCISELEIKIAGHYKTSYSLSLADAVCLAAAFSRGATIITCDHEFDPVEQAEPIHFLWIRAKPAPKKQ
jgi:predicted nucleic acid-binding protein